MDKIFDYNTAIEYINGCAYLGSRPGLERTRELLKRLGDPQKKLKFVHVAGTNGKGSTCAVLSSILRVAGYKTGLYTSPYLVRLTESITVDGKEIPQQSVAQLMSEIAAQADEMSDHPTVFELKTCLAFLYFERCGCDIVVCEVGMGGRLDSTNVIDASEVAVITNIGLDHTKELGGTVALIAAEKAGIIKRGCRAVMYSQSAEAQQAVQRAALFTDVPLTLSDFSEISLKQNSCDGQVFDYKQYSNVATPLLGENQRRNTATALEAVTALKSRGWVISDRAVKTGILSVVWPARFEICCRAPYIVVDGGHNPQCAKSVSDNLNCYFPDKRVIFVIGVLADKDYPAVIKQYLPIASRFITLTPNSPRALSAEALAEHIRGIGGCAHCGKSIPAALEQAKSVCGKDEIICASGSLYLVGLIREYLLGE